MSLSRLNQLNREIGQARRLRAALLAALEGLEALLECRARVVTEDFDFGCAVDGAALPGRYRLAYELHPLFREARRLTLLAAAEGLDGKPCLLVCLRGGFIYLDRDREFTTEELAMAGLVGQQLSSVAEKFQGTPRVGDAITGLPDRLWFANQLHSVSASHFAILAVEIDGFGEFNRSHGAARGDQLLRDVVAFLSDRIKANDLLARSQCDEFLVLVHRADKESLASEWREHLAAFEELGYQVTLSLGLACYPEDGDKPRQLLELAERACLRATGLSDRLVLISSQPQLKLTDGEGFEDPTAQFDMRARAAVGSAVAECQTSRRHVDGVALLWGIHEQVRALSKLLAQANLTAGRVRAMLVQAGYPTVEFTAGCLAIFAEAQRLAQLAGRQTIGADELLLASLADATTEEALRSEGISYGKLLRLLYQSGLLASGATLIIERYPVVRYVEEQTQKRSQPPVIERKQSDKPWSDFLDAEVWQALAVARDEAQRMRADVCLEHLYLGLVSVQGLATEAVRAAVGRLEVAWIQPQRSGLNREVVALFNEMGEIFGGVDLPRLERILLQRPEILRLLESLEGPAARQPERGEGEHAEAAVDESPEPGDAAQGPADES